MNKSSPESPAKEQLGERARIIELLKEGATVLDEPYHHRAIANAMLDAAALLSEEQPVEQFAAPAGGGSQPVDTSTERDRGRVHAVPSESPILAVPQVAAPDVAAMYRRGFEDGVQAYAWYKDGVQQVGTTGNTLRKALADIEKTWNYSPPPPERP